MKAIIETRFGDVGTGRIDGAAYSSFNFQLHDDGIITLQFHGHGKPGITKQRALTMLKTAINQTR